VTTLRLDPAATREFLVAVYIGYGMPEPTATAVADHLVDASRAGVHSHGLGRAVDYLDQMEAGGFVRDAEPVLVRDDGALSMYDAGGAIGPYAGTLAVAAILPRVAAHGIAAVTMRRAGHFGRLGAYVEPLAKKGHVGLAFCSLPTTFRGVPWFGSRDPIVSSNPMAYAIPTEGEPIVADFSTSAVAEGKVRIWAREGTEAPPDAVLDPHGDPTLDPGALYGDPRGMLAPLGGVEFGHKGSALALLVEAMAGFMADESWTDTERTSTLTLLALRAPASLPGHAEEFAHAVRGSTPIDPDRPPHVPGEHAAARRNEPWVEVNAEIWVSLVTRAAGVGVEPPQSAVEGEHP
jgi:L-lactate dehydrogenase